MGSGWSGCLGLDQVSGVVLAGARDQVSRMHTVWASSVSSQRVRRDTDPLEFWPKIIAWLSRGGVQVGTRGSTARGVAF